MFSIDTLFPSRDIRRRLERVETALDSRLGGLEQRLEAIEQRGEETADDLSNSISALAETLNREAADIRNRLEAANLAETFDREAAEIRNRLEAANLETKNLLLQMNTADQNFYSRSSNLIGELVLRFETLNLETKNAIAHLQGEVLSKFNTLFNNAIPTIERQSHIATALQLQQSAHQSAARLPEPRQEEAYQPATAQDFDEVLKLAAADFPTVFADWKNRLDATKIAFDKTMVGNAANPSDLYSRAFASFVRIHTRARVLDIGCGVFGLPYYLSEYPADLVSGLEPLESTCQNHFEFVQGIGEYLPWPDNSFSTVISATSLDHCISLDRTLDEISRVLAPGGTVLLWIGSTPGAPPFAPDSPQFQPIDEFHLFHFDVAWFDPLIAETWDVVDRLEFDMPSYTHVFYALKLK